MNTWNNNVRQDISEDDSGLSDISSSLDQHKNPSARYEEYTVRREIFFARGSQPQDAHEEEDLKLSFGDSGSQRNLVMAYEQRKRESLAQQKLLREKIMEEMKQAQKWQVQLDELQTTKTLVPF